MRPRTWLTIACALLAIPASATAHADLRSADEVAPGVIRVELSGPVEEAFLAATSVGARARTLPARVDPADPQAVIVSVGAEEFPSFRLRVLSRDGHVTTVAVPGDTDAAAGADPPAAVAADWFTMSGLLGLLGLVTFRFWIVAPAWRASRPRPPGAADGDVWREATRGSLRAGAVGWWTAGVTLAVLAAAGLIAGLVATAIAVEAGAGDVGTLLADTRWGRSWTVQAAGLAAAVVVGVALRRSREACSPDVRAGWGYAIAGPLAVAAVAISFASHASTGTDAGLGIGIDAAHLLATAAWIGGLVGMVAIVPRALRTLGASDGTRLAAGVVVRFSGLAIVCVALLVVTGVYRAIGEISTPADLVDTAYGVTLLVKVGLFAVLLVGGAYNRLALHPRLERAALGLRDDDGGATRRLRISVTAEIVLAAAVIGAAAVLVNLPPP